jgi:cytochrome c
MTHIVSMLFGLLLLAGCGRDRGEPAHTAAAPATTQSVPIRSAPPQPAAGWASLPRFDLGRPATRAEIRAWDTDVTPDGTGLPAGRGTAREGARLYAVQCAACHGPKGEGAAFDKLVDATRRPDFPFGRDPDLTKTIGNYWPYATTLYDYIQRAMPQYAPSTLTPDETYSLTAYLLYLNGIIAEQTEMNARTLPKVAMPARDRFVRDNRRGGPEIR